MIPQIFINVGQFFASLRLTIFILLGLAMAMSMGTIYEAEQGTPAAQVMFYRAWWFDGLLVLLTLNLVGCTYLRRPKRTTRWAYLLMHNSILVIFAGGLIGRWYGSEGQLAFAEGQTKNSILQDGNVLRATFDSGDSYEFDTKILDAFPNHTRPNHTFHLNRHGIDLNVRSFFPDYGREHGATVGGPQDPPAVKIEFTKGRKRTASWLFTQGAHDSVNIAGLPITLRSGAAPAGDDQAPPVGGVLELQGNSGEFQYLIPATTSVGDALKIPGTDYTVTVLQTFQRFTMTRTEPVDAEEGDDNPAAIFKITGGGVDQTRVVFANFPQFDDEHGKKTSRVSARYHFHPHALELFLDPRTNELTARLTEPEQVTAGPIVPGTKYPVPTVEGVSFQIIHAFPHAQEAMIPVNRSNKLQQPAFEIELENLAGRATLWVPFETEKKVAFGDSIVTLKYTKREIPLGFELELKDFEVGRYQGTMNPASFSSTVQMRDPAMKLDEESVISMNRPLIHNGFTCYQSSYVEGPRMVSILSVAQDPGGTIAYIGFTGFMIGFICVITFRQNRPKRRSKEPVAKT